jgi:hypothetical protein
MLSSASFKASLKISDYLTFFNYELTEIKAAPKLSIISESSLSTKTGYNNANVTKG